ncbi:hypothetical protein BJ742DRAFT_831701 [Cladochytrium replicatum]|nr:hypothetical protein BJ742DRAFT_831701 [Cladochytrium replicatum]
MPKIVSSSTLSSSDSAAAQAELSIYYCLCGYYALSCETSLKRLPKRRTDNATIIPKETIVMRHDLKEGTEPIIIQRPAGYEKQLRLHCKNCNLPVAYTCGLEMPYVYIMDSSLSDY